MLELLAKCKQESARNREDIRTRSQSKRELEQRIAANRSSSENASVELGEIAQRTAAAAGSVCLLSHVLEQEERQRRALSNEIEGLSMALAEQIAVMQQTLNSTATAALDVADAMVETRASFRDACVHNMNERARLAASISLLECELSG